MKNVLKSILMVIALFAVLVLGQIVIPFVKQFFSDMILDYGWLRVALLTMVIILLLMKFVFKLRAGSIIMATLIMLATLITGFIYYNKYTMTNTELMVMIGLFVVVLYLIFFLLRPIVIKKQK